MKARDHYKRKKTAEGGAVVNGVFFAPRKCIGHCGKEFQPISKYNRICPSCEEANKDIHGDEYKVSRKFEGQ